MSINKNKAKTVYAVIFITLFQLVSPAVFALMFESEQSGEFVTICTTQGYKQVWIDSNDKQHDTNSVDLNCPYCLLNIGAMDAINTSKYHYFGFINKHTYGFTTTQNNIQSKILFEFLAIRAPPYFEVIL